VDAGERLDPAVSRMLSPHAGGIVSHVSRGQTERVLLEPVNGSGPDGQGQDGQQAVWEQLKALEAERLDDVQIAARLNAEEGGRRWNRGSLRALRRAKAPLLSGGAPLRPWGDDFGGNLTRSAIRERCHGPSLSGKGGRVPSVRREPMVAQPQGLAHLSPMLPGAFAGLAGVGRHGARGVWPANRRLRGALASGGNA
jgi:hypothetical protein